MGGQESIEGMNDTADRVTTGAATKTVMVRTVWRWYGVNMEKGNKIEFTHNLLEWK